MAVKIEKLTEQGILGEAPFWHEETQGLYYVDILQKSVHYYNPTTDFYAKAIVGEKNVSFIIPIEGKTNQFLIGYGNEIAKIEWDGKSDKIANIETVAEIKNTETIRNRWNDGKVDPSGRLWAGIFLPNPNGGFFEKQGNLYTLQSNGSLKVQAKGFTLSNGLAWDTDRSKFYYIDTAAREVYQYDYDDKACALSNQEVIFSFEKTDTNGRPDGMTIDADGNIYVAAIGTGKILKINPRWPGKVLQEIQLPAIQVTSVEFGGPNYEDLYVTTARFKTDFEEIPEGPEHGATYRVKGLGVRGSPGRKVRF